MVGLLMRWERKRLQLVARVGGGCDLRNRTWSMRSTALERQADAERRTETGAGALGFDVAAVVGDDAMGDRKARAQRPCPPRRRVKNGSKMRRSTSGSMPQPLSTTESRAWPSLATSSIRTVPPSSRLSSALLNRFKHDLFDLLRIHRGDDRFARGELDVLPLVFSDVAEHFEHAADQFGQIRVFGLARPGARKVEQLLGDPLAAERLGLDHPQVVAHHGLLRIGFVERVAEPAFERLGAHGDRGQRIVDFVGHAGRQESRRWPTVRRAQPASSALEPGGPDRRESPGIGPSCR